MSLQSLFKPVRLFCLHYVPENCDLDLAPIIFIHGVASIHTTWNKVTTKIADNTQRQIFSIDLRNHGQSEWSDVSHLDAMAEDVQNFMSVRGIQKAILIGHSLGGKVAMKFALFKPELTSKIVVEDTPLRGPEEDEAEMFADTVKVVKQLRLLPKSFTEREAQKCIVKMVKASSPELPIQNEEALYVPLHKDADGHFVLDFNVDALVKALRDRTLFQIDLDKCQPVSMPALFVFGEKSISGVNEDESIPKFFPNAELCNMKDGAHMPHVECIEEFVEVVCRFISTT